VQVLAALQHAAKKGQTILMVEHEASATSEGNFRRVALRESGLKVA
jgi:ABC-type Mn2+/Zn2+ transport system ATPase subunit